MDLADLVGAGSDAAAARRYDLGEDWQDVVAWLRREFPEASLNTIYAAANRGREAWSSGTGFDAAPDDYVLSAGDVPRALPGMTSWQYSGLAHFGTQQDGITKMRTVVVSAAKSMSRGEVRAAFAAAGKSMLESDYLGTSEKLKADQVEYLGESITGATRK